MNVTAPWSAVVFKPKGINCLVHITEAAVLRSKLIEGRNTHMGRLLPQVFWYIGYGENNSPRS